MVRATGMYLEVQVGAGGMSGGADITDVLSGIDALPSGDMDAMRPHMYVSCGDFLAADGVLNGDLSRESIDHACVGDKSICEGKDRSTVGGCPVGAGVQAGFAGDWVDSWTKG